MPKVEVKDKNAEDWKRFRRSIGREIVVVRREQKEHWIPGRRYYLRVLTTAYEVLGWNYEKFKEMSPKQWAETKVYLQGIVDWCVFLLTIQPSNQWQLTKERLRKETEK